MPSNYERERLIGAIAYFAKHTEHCGLTKIYKLLSFLDFEHYKAVGQSVTSLGYKAWDRGPLPPALDNEIKNGVKPDMAAVLRFEQHPYANDKEFYKVVVTNLPDNYLDYFSPRQKKIMKSLAEKHKYDTADQMVKTSHESDRPWHRVWVEQKRKYEEIPYDYVIPDQGEDKDFIDLVKIENGEIRLNFG